MPRIFYGKAVRPCNAAQIVCGLQDIKNLPMPKQAISYHKARNEIYK